MERCLVQHWILGSQLKETLHRHCKINEQTPGYLETCKNAHTVHMYTSIPKYLGSSSASAKVAQSLFKVGPGLHKYSLQSGPLLSGHLISRNTFSYATGVS